MKKLVGKASRSALSLVVNDTQVSLLYFTKVVLRVFGGKCSSVWSIRGILHTILYSAYLRPFVLVAQDVSYACKRDQC